MSGAAYSTELDTSTNRSRFFLSVGINYKQMTKDEAINAIYNGNLVECTKQEYPEIRTALQDKAGKMVGSDDGLRAMMTDIISF